jgi:hypothetical protein
MNWQAEFGANRYQPSLDEFGDGSRREGGRGSSRRDIAPAKAGSAPVVYDEDAAAAAEAGVGAVWEDEVAEAAATVQMGWQLDMGSSRYQALDDEDEEWSSGKVGRQRPVSPGDKGPDERNSNRRRSKKAQ